MLPQRLVSARAACWMIGPPSDPHLGVFYFGVLVQPAGLAQFNFGPHSFPSWLLPRRRPQGALHRRIHQLTIYSASRDPTQLPLQMTLLLSTTCPLTSSSTRKAIIFVYQRVPQSPTIPPRQHLRTNTHSNPTQPRPSHHRQLYLTHP